MVETKIISGYSASEINKQLVDGWTIREQVGNSSSDWMFFIVERENYKDSLLNTAVFKHLLRNFDEAEPEWLKEIPPYEEYPDARYCCCS